MPPPDASAGWWDSLSGRDDSRAVVEERIAEDRAALALAGRSPMNLAFLDRQYRAGRQAVEPLVGALHGAVPTGALVLAPGALAPSPANLVAPGAGREPHPDHAAVRSAALALRSAGFDVALYADLPHASAGGWPDWVVDDGNRAHGRQVAGLWQAALAATGVPPDQLVADVYRLAPDPFAAKVEAVRRYASQVEVIERAFGRRLDDPGLLGYEVVWRLPAVAEAA
jgi:LmbE family N-acetylglucosaminyl deacetylase